MLTSDSAGSLPPEGVTAIAPLVSGVYVDNLAKCNLESLPFETEHLSQRLVSGESITWGKEDGCSTTRTDIRDGITLFRGTCSGEGQSFQSQWRFDVLSNESFVDIDMFTSAVPEPPRTFSRCPTNSKLDRTYFGWARARLEAEKNDRPTPLPMDEGVFASMPAGCPDKDGTLRNEREQSAADSRVTILDGHFNQAEESCPIAFYTKVFEKGVLSMNCMNGDTPMLYQFEIEPLSRSSFKRHGEVYELCSGPGSDVSSRTSETSGFQLCAKMANSTARLKCFDDWAKKASGLNAVASASSVERTTATDKVTSLRDLVRRKLLDHASLRERQTKFSYLPGAYQAALAQGLVAKVWYHMGPGAPLNSWKAAVTPRGRERGLTTSTPQSFTVVNPVSIDLEITGMTDTSAGQDQMKVEFKWWYNTSDSIIRRYSETGGTGVATLRLWDDGWRVEREKIWGNGLPFVFTSKLSQEVSFDLSAAASDGAPWIFVESMGTFISERSTR